MNRRLLLLSYAFPPAGVPEAFLSAKRLGNIPDFDVDVVCLQPGADIRLDYSLDGYVATRFKHIERLQLPRLLHAATGGNTSAVLQTPGFYHWMNGRTLRAATRLLQAKRYDVIVTWSQWHAIHLVGLALKNRFRKLPWIAHFSDPWVDNPFANYDPVRRAYERHLEHKVFGSADVISLTSRETIDLVFAGRRARYRDATIEIPHVFDPSLYPDVVAPQSGKLLFRSLGAFYGPRSPEPLFRGLALLRDREPDLFKRITVELVGSVRDQFLESAALRSLPTDAVQVLPSVDYRASLGLMRSADLLLNMDAPFAQSPFLPSKLVDYIGAARPVFGITPPGAASRVIRTLGGWVAAPNDIEAIAKSLADVARYVEANRGRSWGEQAVREQYSSVSIAPRLGDTIDRAIASASQVKSIAHVRNRWAN